ncbi:hypothetical protein ABZ816_28800 [Actinosynnema sp. NPDC047251]|uniref:Uncharacterized protein n=1 Tax=Saccharothrix espanaensis (strain ATCC 51144 / DSM 44229 / JCM 9112 / NBRC 15066 / NRRL 15764) TaxID=1179773 RepID=K0JW06_SACES|nr:hypothetical protein [Saccharothrix espanaensis]CCH28388.1 hypothetical protein BN6_10600 [Saccharothrix espanaensis DSM 44229]
MPEKFANEERAALIMLMLENRDVLNTELDRDLKARLGKPGRERLNRAGLLQSWTVKRQFVHRITDEGISWCLKDLAAGGPPSKSGPLSRAQSAVLTIFVQYHVWRGDLAEVIRSGGGLESVIRTAYLALSVKSQDWVRLAKLRPQLNGAERDEVDAALLAMVQTGTVHLAPDSNRKVLTEADHAAAIRIAGEDNHLVAIEES